MSEINNYIAGIKEELNQVLFGLNGVDEYNFEEKMGFVQQKFVSIKSKKDELNERFDKNDLEKFNPEMDLIIKQISIKFDNMIDEWMKNKNKVGQELQKKQNEKKLVNYKR